MPGEATAWAPNALPPPKRSFSVAEADRALVLVRRVVGDIVEKYRELVLVRARLEELSSSVGVEEEVARLRARMESLAETLHRLHEELNEIGCQLKDWQRGLVDFPAVRAGRAVFLCWALGEESVRFWHEIDAGFAGRQPIGPDF